MNTKLLSTISGLILTAGCGLANAESITLSNTQMDTVTAGVGNNFSQSVSISQIENDGVYTRFNLAVFAQGDSAVANASAIIIAADLIVDTQAPMAFSSSKGLPLIIEHSPVEF